MECLICKTEENVSKPNGCAPMCDDCREIEIDCGR